jgi:hypothetical protein
MTDYFKNAKLSEASKKHYNFYIAKWLTLGFSSMREVLDSPDKSMKALEALSLTPSTKHAYLSAAVGYILHCVRADHQHRYKTKWLDLQKENQKPMQERYTNQEPTANQTKNAVSWKQVLEAREANPDNLLLAIYTYIPPVRADYNKVHLIREGTAIPKGENYILMGSEYKLVLQEFKTAKTYTTIEHVLPERLKKLLEKSLAAEPRDYLFVSPLTREPQTAARFAEWAGTNLSKLIGKKTSLTALRHAFVHTLDYNMPFKELKAITEGMGHSIRSSMLYKSNINELVVPKQKEKAE